MSVISNRLYMERVIDISDFQTLVLTQLNIQRKNCLFCDASIVTRDGKVFHAHKAILAASSTYFESSIAHIDNQIKEKFTPDDKIIINLTSISSHVLACLLDLIYTSKLDLTQNNVFEVAMAADCLKLPQVKEVCRQFYSEKILQQFSPPVQRLPSMEQEYEPMSVDDKSGLPEASSFTSSPKENSKAPCKAWCTRWFNSTSSEEPSSPTLNHAHRHVANDNRSDIDDDDVFRLPPSSSNFLEHSKSSGCTSVRRNREAESGKTTVFGENLSQVQSHFASGRPAICSMWLLPNKPTLPGLRPDFPLSLSYPPPLVIPQSSAQLVMCPPVGANLATTLTSAIPGFTRITPILNSNEAIRRERTSSNSNSSHSADTTDRPVVGRQRTDEGRRDSLDSRAGYTPEQEATSSLSRRTSLEAVSAAERFAVSQQEVAVRGREIPSLADRDDSPAAGTDTNSPSILANQQFANPAEHKTSATETPLRTRRSEAERRIYQCNMCSSKFHNRAGLSVHLRSHTGERPYRCSVCGKAFTQLGHVQRHQKVHTGEKPFQCTWCHARVRDKASMHYHILAHKGIKPFECDECEARFTKRSSLVKHKNVHTGDFLYQCPQCKASFREKASLSRHRRCQHSADNQGKSRKAAAQTVSSM